MTEAEGAGWIEGGLVLIPGAPKAGTTTLHAALARHPACRTLGVKEPQYLALVDDDMSAHAAWYRSLFASEHALHVDASTSYLYHPQAAERARMLEPGVRAIIVLRDPARRSFSGYLHSVRRAILPESRSFAAILDDVEARLDLGSLWDAEESSIQDAMDQGRLDPSLFTEGFLARTVGGPTRSRFGDPLWAYRYLGASQYSRFVPAWEAALPGAVLVLCMEELIDEPRRVLESVSDFLGIDARGWPSELERKNKTRIPRGRLGRLAFRLANDTGVGRAAKGIVRWAGLDAAIERVRASAEKTVPLDPDIYRRTRRLLAAEYAYWRQRLPCVAEYWEPGSAQAP